MKIYLFVLTVCVAILGIASLIPAAFSVMIVGDPGAFEKPASVALFVSIFTCPVVCQFVVK